MSQSTLREIHFIDDKVSEADRELLLGPFEQDDGPFVTVQPGWTMAHLMMTAEVFPSAKQAKANGWDKPIPPGYSEYTVGKRKLKVYVLTTFDHGPSVEILSECTCSVDGDMNGAGHSFGCPTIQNRLRKRDLQIQERADDESAV